MRLLGIALLLLASTAPCCRSATPSAVSAAVPLTNSIGSRQLYLSGVTIGSTTRQVVKAFGPPVSIEPLERYEPEDDPGQLLNYVGLQVLVLCDTVHKVTCTSPAYATRDGVRVGDSLARVRDIYGAGERYTTSEGNDLVRFGVPGEDKYLVFILSDERIQTIVLFFDFT